MASTSHTTDEKSLPKHPTNKKPYPHSPAASLVTPQGDLVSITYDALDVQKATKDVASRWAGAAVVFLGMTRDDRSQGTGEDASQELRVARLEYEAYTPLAMKTLHSIVHRARTTPTTAWPPADLHGADLAKMETELESAMTNVALHQQGGGHTSANGTPAKSNTSGSLKRRSKHIKEEEEHGSPPPADSIIRIALINRLGPVEVGESSILVAVSAPHRRRAFEVAEWLLEETKRKVPIWKREVRVKAESTAKGDKAKEVEDEGRGWVGLAAGQKDNTTQGVPTISPVKAAEQGGHQVSVGQIY